MDNTQSQGLLVAACLIGCTVFAVTLCIRVLPDPADWLSASEETEHKSPNRLVLGWVVLACTSIVAGHLIAFHMLGATAASRSTITSKPAYEYRMAPPSEESTVWQFAYATGGISN
ncbi:hypothetical protein ACQZ3V_01935 [Ralstonia pseudosolanacearum]|uniref:hypothetical protein n=1 Tax=Ralstonia pseudosolanacearum TaxID=1310165 RepID=UPI001FFBA5E4